jgi:hypothetical protein
MGIKGLLIAAILLAVSLLIVPGALAETCTPTSSLNCLDITCRIQGDNNVVIYGNTFDGERYVRNESIELEYQKKHIRITSTADLEGLSVNCPMPEFNTKYCTYRGQWHTNVTVERHYINKDTGSRDKETFTLMRMTAFDDCKDWIPPRVQVLNQKPNYATGSRVVEIVISDDESHIASNDATVPLHCAYQSAVNHRIRTTPLRIDNDGPPVGWTIIEECDGERHTTLPREIFQDDASEYLIVYAIDTAGNFVYHVIDPYPMYPSLPTNKDNGFCPRPNECFVSNIGDPEINTFDLLYEGEPNIPLCVEAGSTINDAYCDARRGLMSKSERLYELSREASNAFGTSNITIYCSELKRTATLLTSDTIPNKCSFETGSREGNCANACSLYVQASGIRNAFLYTSLNRPAEVSLPGILPYKLNIESMCGDPITSPFIFNRCTYNFRTLQLKAFYYYTQSLLHIGTQESGIERNLSISAANQLHNEPLIVNLRSNMSYYFHTTRAGSNAHINQAVFDGKNGAYEYVAYRSNGDYTALAMRIDTRRADQHLTLSNNPIIVGAIYHNYNGDDIEAFAKSITPPSLYPYDTISVYRHGSYTVVVGSVSGDTEAARLIEQLVVRLRPGGLT